MAGEDRGGEGRRPEDLAREVGRSAGELARAEADRLRADLRSAGGGVAALGASGLLAMFGMNLLTFAAADALARRVPRWSALALVGGGLLSLGAAAGLLGLERTAEPLERVAEAVRRDLRIVLRAMR